MLEEGLDWELKGASPPGVLPYQVDPYEAFRQQVRRQWELECQNMGSEVCDEILINYLVY